jgi:hypothetical protein
MNAALPTNLVDRLRQVDAGPTVLPDGTGVFVDLDGHRVLSLSKTGVALIQQIQSGVSSLEALAQALEGRFDVTFPQALEDTEAFVAELNRILCN